MSFLPVYLDTSAIVKLVVREAESEALAASLAPRRDRLSCVLARVELHRALWRAGVTRAVWDRAEAVLASLVLLRIDEPVLSRAAAFPNRDLRALDALHLAAALTLGDDPDAFVTYDARLARAAAQQRLLVEHPGVDRLG